MEKEYDSMQGQNMKSLGEISFDCYPFESQIGNPKEVITFEVFKNIVSYSAIRGFSGISKKRLYNECFKHLNDKTYIQNYIEINKHFENRLEVKESAFALVLLFVYYSDLCSPWFIELFKKYERDITGIATTHMDGMDKKDEFRDYGQKFWKDWKIAHPIESHTINSGIKAELDDLAYDCIGKLYEIFGRKNKEYEDKIKQKEDEIDCIIEDSNYISAKYESVRTKYSKALKDNENMNARIGSLMNELSSMKAKIDTLQEEISRMELQKENDVNAYCAIAVRYMNANRKKSQNYREKVKASLVDIMSQLKLALPEDIHRAINNFDDDVTPREVTVNINGDITNNGGTVTGNLLNG